MREAGRQADVPGKTRFPGMCCLQMVLLKPPPRDCPGGPIVKNLPANAGDTGSVPGWGRFHMPWGN